MPYIRVSLAQKLPPEKQAELVKGLGEALSIIPGKDGRGLIVDLEDGKTIYCGGVRQEDFVFLDVRYYSNFAYKIKKEFTVAVFNVLNKVLGTPKEKMFLTINEYNSWGGFGDFRDEYYSD
ncbi:MAG: hypothetical protein QM368_06830 [Bacillota bacterium]|jgi:hypothetical protein|nr:hypothetical protein [Bacillota bacterium]HHU30582.1 hypothetical protein [Bacillota bacterium]